MPSERFRHSPHLVSILDMSPEAVAAFLQGVKATGDQGSILLDKDFDRHAPVIKDAFEIIAAQDSPNRMAERRAFLRGVLATVELIRFLEEGGQFEQLYAVESVSHPVEDATNDGGDDEARPPLGESGGGRSTDVRFLAPPDL